MLQQNIALNRFAFIDGLRGIAAISVTVFHFYRGTPFYEQLSRALPRFLSVILENGWLGVEVFFVVSGFIIAYSLRKAQINFPFLYSFVLCRYVRLAPPYLISILLIIILNTCSNLVFTERVAPLPNWETLIAHIFYLQGLLNLDKISPVFWTLCLEVQFYIAFIALIGVAQFLQQRTDLRESRIVPSILVFSGSISVVQAVFFDFHEKVILSSSWYLFTIGILICWVSEKKGNAYWLWIHLTSLMIFSFIQPWNGEVTVALGTGILIWRASRLDKMHYWLSAKWIQYLGKISYSLYLVHTIIGTRIINLGYRISGNNPLAASGWMILAFTLSIIAAHYLYAWVENPSIHLSKRLKSKFT